MMKNKKTIIFIICLVLIALLAVGILLIISTNKAKDAEKRGHTEVANLATLIYDYANSKKIGESGTIKATAQYKGAHGEKHPANFDLVYELDMSNLNLSISGDKGYNEKQINSKLLNFVRILRTTDKDTFVKAFKDLDVKSLNTILNTDYKKMDLKVYKEGFFSDFKYCELTIDDILITIKENDYTLKKGNNEISLKTNSTGYSLNINNILKMNVFPDKVQDKYNIVVNGYSFYVTISDKELTLDTSSQAAIYNGLNLVFTYNSNSKVNKETLTEYDEIPVFRYFGGVEINIWK